MERTESNREPIEELAEEFAERQRRGERPTIKEYVAEYPELADEIQELFPTLQFMEELKPEVVGVPVNRAGGSASGGPPTVLGDYCILREVGRGGMGIVYEAEQKSLGRRVALKVLSNQLLANEKQKKRFEHESRTAARLHHTNIVPVYGVGQHDGVYYYVMQFIQGQGLEEVLIEVRRLRDRASSQHTQNKIENTRPAVDGSTPKDGTGSSVNDLTVQRAALSMVTGQFEQPQLSDSTSVPSGKVPTPREQLTEPATSGAQPDAVQRPNGGQDIGDSGSSSSHLLTDGSGIGYWSKARSTYYRNVARIGAQAADALHYAHQQGVLHRDIKPSNLMLDTRGNVWITDFGLAKAEDQQSLTQTGDIVGTLRYMAPEMFSGRADARSDVCELGLTLYEMLALRPAFDATDRSRLVHQVLSQPPPRLDTIDRHIPRDLVTIVHKAIDHDQTTRYCTAAELRDDLQRFLHDEPIQARRISLVARGARWCKRNPAIAVLMGTVAMLLLMGAIIAGTAAYHFRKLAGQLGIKKTEAESAQIESLHSLHDAYLSQARASRWSGRSGQRLDSLDALAKAAELVPQLGLGDNEVMELRNEAIACMALTDLRIVKTCKRPKEAYFGALDFCSDLTTYARPDPEGNIIIGSVPDDRITARLPGKGATNCLQFSPDGHFLAVFRDHETLTRLAVWDLASKKRILDVPNCQDLWDGAFSPDSRSLAAHIADESIRVFDLATGGELTRIFPSDTPAHFCFHPDGSKLGVGVTGTTRNAVEIWDLDRREVLRTLPLPGGVMGIAWRPDGKLLAAACLDSRIYIWESDSGTQLFALEGHKSSVHHVAFHPTQNLLVSHAWDGTTRLWSLADGRQLLATDGYFVRFDTKGRQLAFRNGLDIGLWEVSDRPECETLYGTNGRSEDIRGVAISPDGRLMASGAVLGRGTRLWDLSTFKQLATLPTGTAPSIRFHPTDGSLITSSNRGLLKWPIERHTTNASEQLVIGPPVSLGNRSEMCLSFMDMSPNGNFFAAETADLNRAIVIDATHNRTTILSDGANRSFVTISPGGRWVARGNYGLSGVEVWDVRTGKIVQELPIEGSAAVAFSPDGCWLVIAAKVYQFLETGSWQQRHSITGIGGGNQGGRMAFSPDGQIMAITLARNLVQLIKTDTGRVLADLQVTPKPCWVQWLSFSADGSRLAVACGKEGIRVWDLRRVRQRLGTMDLDWDLPPYPPTAEVADHAPLEVKVNLGPLAGAPHLDRCRDHLQAGRLLEALDEANKAVELNDIHPEAFELRAHVHIALKQYESAVKDLSAVLEVTPNDAMVRNRRGVQYARLNRWKDALADFTQYTKLKPRSALGWFNRAYVNYQLRRSKDALVDFDKAVELDPDTHNFWHQRGHVHERLEQWDEAIADLSEAIELAPNKAEYWRDRGVVQCRRAEWARAIEDFTKAKELEPELAYFDLYELALIQLTGGNADGYEATCAELLERFGETTNPDAASFVAWTSVLVQRPAVDWPTVVAQAKRAAELPAKDNTLAQVALGAAFYRAGRLAEAVKQLTELNRRFEEAEPNLSTCPAYAWFFLAMAHHGLKQPDESRKWLDRATHWQQERLENENQAENAATVPWNRRVTLELLEKEARALVGN